MTQTGKFGFLAHSWHARCRPPCRPPAHRRCPGARPRCRHAERPVPPGTRAHRVVATGRGHSQPGDSAGQGADATDRDRRARAGLAAHRGAGAASRTGLRACGAGTDAQRRHRLHRHQSRRRDVPAQALRQQAARNLGRPAMHRVGSDAGHRRVVGACVQAVAGARRDGHDHRGVRVGCAGRHRRAGSRRSGSGHLHSGRRRAAERERVHRAGVG